MQNSKPILLVEDDAVDVMMVKRVLKDMRVTSELVQAGDGEQALAYLRDDGNAKPCIILLDLNMPKMNGIELMRIMKTDEVLQRIPIIVLTTSNSDQDIFESFELGAAGYMLKSVDYKKFVEIIKTIDLYWTLSKLPLN